MEEGKKKTIEFSCKIKAPFYSYGSVDKDLKAVRHMKKYIRSFFRDELAFIPLDNNDEDTSCKTTITISE